MRTRFLAAAAATAIAAPGLLLVAPAAVADIGSEGRCGGAEYNLDVDRDGARLEVEASIDDARSGSSWRVVLRHNGTVIHAATHRADREGEIDVERRVSPTRGKNRFRLVVTPVGGKKCAAVVVVPKAGTARSRLCWGAEQDLEVKARGTRLRVEAELDHARPGSRWRATVRHNGKRVRAGVVKANAKGKIRIKRNIRAAAGKNAVKWAVRPVAKKRLCVSRVVMR